MRSFTQLIVILAVLAGGLVGVPVHAAATGFAAVAEFAPTPTPDLLADVALSASPICNYDPTAVLVDFVLKNEPS